MRCVCVARQIASAALLAGVLLAPASAARLPAAPSIVEHKVYGTVQSLRGSTLVIRTRSGRMVTVDGRAARSTVLLTSHRPVIVYGTTDAAGVLHATSVWRTFPDAAHWPADH